jgi:hypothetical protein
MFPLRLPMLPLSEWSNFFSNKVIRVADYHRAPLDAITRFFVFPPIPKTGDRQ